MKTRKDISDFFKKVPIKHRKYIEPLETKTLEQELKDLHGKIMSNNISDVIEAAESVLTTEKHLLKLAERMLDWKLCPSTPEHREASEHIAEALYCKPSLPYFVKILLLLFEIL